MKLSVLDKTPGLLFTLLLIAFVIGTMVDSLWTIKNIHDHPPPAPPPTPPAQGTSTAAPSTATPNPAADDDDDDDE